MAQSNPILYHTEANWVHLFLAGCPSVYLGGKLKVKYFVECDKITK